MSLRHAILTALLERPSTGLDLVRRFDRSIRYFWSATHQQIYRELGKMEAEGLIAAVPQLQSTKNRKQYDVLATGYRELVRWVSTYEDPKPVKDALVVRLRAASVVGLGTLVSQLHEHYEAHRRQLELYREIEERYFSGDELTDQDRLQYLTLRAGIGLEEHWVSWIESALAELENPTPPRSGSSEPGGNLPPTLTGQ